MTKRALLLLFAAALLTLPVAFKRLTCGFKIAKMRLEMPFRPNWETDASLSEEQLLSILRQPFFYLDKGAQSYVFKSGDGQFVFKLFH